MEDGKVVQDHFLVSAVRELQGIGAEEVVLFGSRAREEHRPDSDYDLLVTFTKLTHIGDGEVIERTWELLRASNEEVEVRKRLAEVAEGKRYDLLVMARDDWSSVVKGRVNCGDVLGRIIEEGVTLWG